MQRDARVLRRSYYRFMTLTETGPPPFDCVCVPPPGRNGSLLALNLLGMKNLNMVACLGLYRPRCLAAAAKRSEWRRRRQHCCMRRRRRLRRVGSACGVGLLPSAPSFSTAAVCDDLRTSQQEHSSSSAALPHAPSHTVTGVGCKGRTMRGGSAGGCNASQRTVVLIVPTSAAAAAAAVRGWQGAPNAAELPRQTFAPPPSSLQLLLASRTSTPTASNHKSRDEDIPRRSPRETRPSLCLAPASLLPQPRALSS